MNRFVFIGMSFASIGFYLNSLHWNRNALLPNGPHFSLAGAAVAPMNVIVIECVLIW